MSMIPARPPHLTDERLLDCYFTERRGTPVDPPDADHLSECAACAAAYRSLGGFLDGLRDQAEAEADAIFTPERLQAQRRQVASRLAHVGRAARVLSFPGRLVSAHMRTGHPAASRWIAGAAAAGLFIGVGVGMLSESRLDPRAAPAASIARASGNTLQQTLDIPSVAPVPSTADADTLSDGSDEAFLSDLEVALQGPRTMELLPFDALTPYVREISDVAQPGDRAR
jgi:hypothetical protein